MTARSDDPFIEMRIVRDHRSRRRLDDVGEVSGREVLAYRVNGRRREDDVADFSKADEKNP